MERDGFLNKSCVLKVSCLALVLLFAAGSIVAAQQKVTPEANTGGAADLKTAPSQVDKQAKTKGTWSVRMSKSAPHTFTIKAKDAKLGEITGEIARLLRIPVSLSPLMAQQRVTLDFSAMNLEAALRLLAPQPYVDYVAGGEDSPEPKALAVYLHALNERPPSTTDTVKGSSEVMLIEGNTEEGTDSAEKKKEEKTL